MADNETKPPDRLRDRFTEAGGWASPAAWAELAKAIGPLGFLTVFFALLFVGTVFFYQKKHDETMEGQKWLRHDLGQFRTALHTIAEIHKTEADALDDIAAADDAAKRKQLAADAAKEIKALCKELHGKLRADEE
jgi:hypothetical protein